MRGFHRRQRQEKGRPCAGANHFRGSTTRLSEAWRHFRASAWTWRRTHEHLWRSNEQPAVERLHRRLADIAVSLGTEKVASKRNVVENIWFSFYVTLNFLSLAQLNWADLVPFPIAFMHSVICFSQPWLHSVWPLSGERIRVPSVQAVSHQTEKTDGLFCGV